MPQPYDLDDEIGAMLDTTDLTDLDEIASNVADKVPHGQLRPVLRRVLRDYVRVVIGRRRMGDGPVPSLSPTPPPQRPTARSARVRAIREAAPAWLRERVFVEQVGWKLLGDCSASDLAALAAARYENAARSRAVADRYTALADLVCSYGVDRVADLPAAVFEAAA